MKLAQTEYDKIYSELSGLVMDTVAITEAPSAIGDNQTKVVVLRQLTNQCFYSMIARLQEQKDRACKISSN
jgi:hypothetical protein